LTFLILSVLCGLLIAGLTLPAVGAALVVPNTSRANLGALPVAFDIPAQSQRSKVLDARGDVLAYFYEENRVYVRLAQIAPIMRQAIVAIEDHRFYQHGPLDVQGTARRYSPT
jgi:membrane peptidoglycan carboxypeptidase